MAALNELQAAVAAGFTRWIHFQRAIKAGLFPKPKMELPGEGPRWTQAHIDEWLGVPAQPKTPQEWEEELIRRAEEDARRRNAAREARHRRPGTTHPGR